MNEDFDAELDNAESAAAAERDAASIAKLEAELAKARKEIARHKREADAARKRLDETLESMERQRAAQFVIPRGSASPAGGDYCRVIVPDTHGSYGDLDALAAFFGDLERINPREVILLGDHIDCGGFLAQHHTLGYVAEGSYTFEQDVAAANEFLDQIQLAAPNARMDYLEGNHECLTPDHEVLTRRGWVAIADVVTTDWVATMRDDGTHEWTNPLAVHSRWYEGDIYVYDGTSLRISMTPNHRVWYWSQNGTDLLCRKAYLLNRKTGCYDVPCATINTQPDAPYTDDELRLLGWILTDGTLSSGRVEIFQSKDEHLDTIRDILLRLNLDYSERVRRRKPSKGIATARPAHIFYLKPSSKELVKTRLFPDGTKTLPAFVHALSSRQVAVLLGSLLDGDGTRVDEAATLYGKQEFLEAVQALLVVNGYRTSLAYRTRSNGSPGYHCLNISKRSVCRLDTRHLRTEKYSGYVYCLTTDNDNFVVRHGGRVSVTGNSRIQRWCITQALRNSCDASFLNRRFSPEVVLHLDQRRIDYWSTSEYHDNLAIPGAIKRGKFCYVHGISHADNAAKVHLAEFGCCVVFAHIHRKQSYSKTTVHAGDIAAWCDGCLCQRRPYYMHPRKTNWQHGYGLEMAWSTGEALHLTVPIIDGKSFLGPLFDEMA